MGNLAQNLLDTAAKQGRRPALRMGDTVLTYDQFGDAAGRVAAGLETRGVTPGDRVGMLLPDTLSFPILFYGALMAGAAVVPMNPLLNVREIHYQLRDSGARLVVAAQASAQAAAEAADAIGIEAVAVDGVQPDALMAAHERRLRLRGPTTTRRRSSTPPGPPARRKEPNSPTGTCRATRARPPRRCWRSPRTTSSWVVCRCFMPSGSPAGSTRRCCRGPA